MVYRPFSGENNLAGAGYRRILQGQTLHLHTISNVAVTFRAWARVIYDNGQGQLLTIPEVARSATRVAEDLLSTDVVIHDGWVANAEVECLTDDVKRGQSYVRLTVEPFGAALLADYCSSGFGHVSLGTFGPPGGGPGHVHWGVIKANGAPATFTFSFAVSNTLRKVNGVIWWYAASSDVASRILQFQIREDGGGLPTGFGGGALINTFTSFFVTATADEDVMLFADHIRNGVNDNGTLTIGDNASNPSPLPFLVPEDSTLKFEGTLVDEEALDFDAVWGLFEDWVLL